MAINKWKQWVDETNLFACVGNGDHYYGIDGALMIVQWQDDKWVDVTTALVPEPRVPNAMEHLAMWSCLPEPDPVLLKEYKKRQGT